MRNDYTPYKTQAIDHALLNLRAKIILEDGPGLQHVEALLRIIGRIAHSGGLTKSSITTPTHLGSCPRESTKSMSPPRITSVLIVFQTGDKGAHANNRLPMPRDPSQMDHCVALPTRSGVRFLRRVLALTSKPPSLGLVRLIHNAGNFKLTHYPTA
jgi:hypothetical protein